MRHFLVALALLGAAATAGAAPVTYQFTGTTSNSAMTVNDGTTSGTVPAGTPFSGTLTFDNAQVVTPVAFAGGTHAAYVFTEMTLTIGTTTVTWGPGTIDVYDNLTSSTSGYPIGDSFYANLSSRVAPNGLIDGAQFNFIFLGLVDPTGTAFSSAALPDTLNYASFQQPFLEFNYGTLGTPWGAGNTSMIQPVATLSKTAATPTPAPTVTTTSFPAGVVGSPYATTVTASAPNNDPLTIAVDVLPAGLTFDGAAISGVPTVAGTTNVTIVASDTVTGLSTSSTLPLTITDPAIVLPPPPPVACSGTNAVVSAYVARNPGYIVVNGGLNLLDHLWTTYLNASNTTFLGGLVNWYQTGLIVDYAGTVDPNGCILSSLTVRPAVTIDTAALPDGTVGQTYSAPLSVSWGVPPYSITLSGLPAGLAFDGTNITGVPTAAGAFNVTVTAIDSVGATASKTFAMTVNAAPNYTVADSGHGRITAVGPGYLEVGARRLLWTTGTKITVQTADGERHVIDEAVAVGMEARWKGLRDTATNAVLTSKLEIE